MTHLTAVLLSAGACAAVLFVVWIGLRLHRRLNLIEHQIRWLHRELIELPIPPRPLPETDPLTVCGRCGKERPDKQMNHTGLKSYFGGELVLCADCTHYRSW